MNKECSLLKRLGILDKDDSKLTDWEKSICNRGWEGCCPLQVCVYDRVGAKIHPVDEEMLDNVKIPKKGEL
ncbi:hypothetical protein LCGC14_2416450 [marine sediment metagenome]|uniref:Uncharacterized protein n=1 Tax=marine sediment metagenome TaxID=412755 RepID=A0A0F9BQZ7_9ZZZZ